MVAKGALDLLLPPGGEDVLEAGLGGSNYGSELVSLFCFSYPGLEENTQGYWVRRRNPLTATFTATALADASSLCSLGRARQEQLWSGRIPGADRNSGSGGQRRAGN